MEDGLYCNKNLLKTDPKLCRNFYKATIESWEYVFKNKQIAIDIIEKEMRANNKPFNRAHQIWMLNRFEEIYKDENSIRIFLSEKDYNLNANILLKGNLIKGSTILEIYNTFKHKSEKELDIVKLKEYIVMILNVSNFYLYNKSVDMYLYEKDIQIDYDKLKHLFKSYVLTSSSTPYIVNLYCGII